MYCRNSKDLVICELTNIKRNADQTDPPAFGWADAEVWRTRIKTVYETRNPRKSALLTSALSAFKSFTKRHLITT